MKNLWSSLFACCAASLSASSGPVWTAPQTFPSSSQNVIFPAYNANLGKVVATWVNDVTFAPDGIAFSSTFDGSSWSTPLQLPILPNHTTANVLVNAYDNAIEKTVVLWSDPNIAPPQPNSSTFDGTAWSTPQIIPDGGTGALIPIPAFDPGINQLVATWCDFSGPLGQSSLFDGTNWSTTPLPNPASGALLQFSAPLSNQLVAVWVDLSTLIGYSSVFDGTSWLPAQPIAGNIAPPNLIPVLNNAYNPQSQTLLVTWVDNTTHQVFSSTFDGSTWSAPQAVPGSSSIGAVCPVYDPALGQIVAVWPDSGTSSGAYSLFDGTSWSAALEIPGSSSPASSFLATYDPILGKVITLWTDSLFQGHYSLFYVPSITFLGG
ncbi:MAG: hypothetical protein K2X08_07645, partial [Chlamydiales bacterium]|nr:hypothetical protein [Chlamydiales bacterium]